MQITQLSTASIGEPATYNWYANDSLVHTGTNMTVSPATDQEYKLEVIADADGHKDYDTVSVAGTSNDIEGMTPNPASSSVAVTYDVESAGSASLQINSISGILLGSYSLDLNTNQKTIDVSNYPVGLSIVTLVVDGVNTDSENLVIE